MGAMSVMFAGCRKEEKAPEVPAHSPESYMHDKAFLGKLDEQKSAREQVMRKHIAAVKEFEKAKKDDPKEERPETQEIRKRLVALEAEYQSLRKETLRTVRERITPKAPEGAGK